MTSFPISDDIAEQVTDSVFGPDSRLHPDRVEIVLMALMKVAPDLYAAWMESRAACGSRSPMGAQCELPVGHPTLCAGHLGSSPYAWKRKGIEPVPLPASIDTEATS